MGNYLLIFLFIYLKFLVEGWGKMGRTTFHGVVKKALDLRWRRGGRGAPQKNRFLGT